MRIAIIADPFIPVPPVGYGGIERIIDLLVKGLLSEGHQVALLAHSESNTAAVKFSYSRKNRFHHIVRMMEVSEIRHFKPDIIHSFGRMAYLLSFLFSRTPKIMSYQREPTISQIQRAKKIFQKNSLYFTGCSDYISDQIKPYAPVSTIYNGVELEKYDFKESVKNDAPLLFLGRIEPIKGTHIAIEIAKKTQMKLIIAGNIPEEHQKYFDEEIKPALNTEISYVGIVNDFEKNILLGNASAFLMPIEWNEPFGIVMAEAMACGTPIIGFNRGAVTEIIVDGVNGFKCDTKDEMTNYVKRIGEINRKSVRADVERRFSSQAITKQYLNLYEHLIERR